MNLLRRLRRNPDEGAAMVTVLAIGAAVTGLAATVGMLSVNNLRNTTRDKQAGSALATSEAGVAEAIEFLRSGTSGLGTLTCMEPAAGATPSGACLTNPAGWTSYTAPKEVPVDGGTVCSSGDTCYKVWIGTVLSYAPPVRKYGVYRIHSTGKFGNGPAARNVVVEVKVTPQLYPIGIFGETMTGSGGAGVSRESLFTRSCVTGRSSGTSGLSFTGNDLVNDMPAAAHSTNDISTGNQCKTTWNIHSTSSPCKTDMPYDQSQSGGSLAGTPCYRSWTSPSTGRQYPETSAFTLSDLQSYGYRPAGLSDSVYSELKARAQMAGTYFTNKNADPYSALAALNGAQAILFYEIGAGEKVVLGPGNIPSAYVRQESSSTTCATSGMTIVVKNGGMTLNGIGDGNSSPVTGLAASIFVPDGSYEGQGSVWVIGTLYAKEIKLSGTQDYRLDECFVANPPSVLLDVEVTDFREDDTSDVS